MSFTSVEFLVLFLPIVFGLHALMEDSKLKNILLLLASVVFYSFYDIKYVIFLIASIVITFWGGKWCYFFLSKEKKAYGKIIMLSALVINLAMLIFCKYTNFVVANINVLMSHTGTSIEVPQILLPVGLSFFIFQSSTYLFDIFAGKEIPETSIINYALFVSFFPTITSGPIQRSVKFLPQIRKNRTITWAHFQSGFVLFLWGVFLKLAVADRLAVFTCAVLDNYQQYGFFMILLAILAYSVQIYADFSGYSTMAIGISKLFGFDLDENFRQPYVSTSIAEFWRRWHISLSSWLRDYIYFPLGGNRKGAVRKYLNLAIVFLVSGIWHGASWNFVLWGAIHAVYQVVGALTIKQRLRVCECIGLRRESFVYKLQQRVIVFLLVAFAWVFFRMPTFSQALGVLSAMFSAWDIEVLFLKTPADLGLDTTTIVMILILLVGSILKEKGTGIEVFLKQNTIVRYASCILLILLIILFGAYGPQFSANAFIYAGF